MNPVVDNENENVVEISIYEPSCHLRYLGSLISKKILLQFKNTFSTNSPWTGDVKFKGLHIIWFQMLNESSRIVLQKISNLSDDNAHVSDIQGHELNATNVDAFEFDFPEF